jgi:hypothetical protein
MEVGGRGQELTRTGKPRRSQKCRRPIQVKVRMTEEEHAKLLELSEIARVHPQGVIRMLIAGKDWRPVPKLAIEESRALVGMSRNVNQIAIRLNSLGEFNNEVAVKLIEELGRYIRCLSSK